MFLMLETIKMKNFGVPSIKYARSDGGGVILLKAYFLVWREGVVQLYAYVHHKSFFAGSLQNRNKIKKVSYSDSQNYPFSSPRTVKKGTQGSS